MLKMSTAVTPSEGSVSDREFVMKSADFHALENAREIAARFAGRGDAFGWFDALYREADGNNEYIPWGDLMPNRFFREWAEKKELKGDERSALVVGCGLGDDARYLFDLGFKVIAFDLAPTAIEWAQRLHHDTDVRFEIADLLKPPREWLGAFDFVLEVYTIQPLPLEIRQSVIGAIAAFVAPGGRLVVVTRGRGEDEDPGEMPWPLSRSDLYRFENNGLEQVEFTEMSDSEDGTLRIVAEYVRHLHGNPLN